MTDTEINETIAEVLGYDFDPPEAHLWPSRGNRVKSPKGDILFRTSVPKFCEDLNAMHEAEKMLRPPIQPTWDVWENYCLMLEDDPHATASRRSEVFVKIIGKWRSA